MLLRPGNAGSNTFTDHKEVLAAAIRQVPARFRRKILIRVDGAGASHEFVAHLLSLSSARRAVLFTCGWMITAADEDAIRQVPAGAWKPGTGQDGGTDCGSTLLADDELRHGFAQRIGTDERTLADTILESAYIMAPIQFCAPGHCTRIRNIKLECPLSSRRQPFLSSQ